MDYPQEFSPEARARVEAERLRATRDYEKRRDEIPWAEHRSYREDEENLRHFIMRVFLAFGKEACKLALNEVWTVDKIRSEAEEFLRKFTIEAYYGYGRDANGRKLREMTSNWGGGLLLEVQHEFQKSPEWHEYEDELLAVAEKIAKRSRRKSAPPAQNKQSEIDAFIRNLLEHGHKITKKDIWTVAGYKDATEFERFQRGSARTTASAVSNFNRILKMKPDDFLRLLQKQRSN